LRLVLRCSIRADVTRIGPSRLVVIILRQIVVHGAGNVVERHEARRC
jgi:hypothetical protein